MAKKVQRASFAFNGFMLTASARSKKTPEVREMIKRQDQARDLLRRASPLARARYYTAIPMYQTDMDKVRVHEDEIESVQGAGDAAFAQARTQLAADVAGASTDNRRAGMAKARESRHAPNEESYATARHMNDAHGWGTERIAGSLGTTRKVVRTLLGKHWPVRSDLIRCKICGLTGHLQGQ